MSDSIHFSLSYLMNLGIIFKNVNDAEAFAEVINEELEVRIGIAVAKGKTKQEMDLFEQCVTDDETEAWLNEHCPNYREICKSATEKLMRELVRYRSEIAGVKVISPESALRFPVDFLGVRFSTRDLLLKTGLTTVEDVVRNFDRLEEFLPDEGLRTIHEIQHKARPYRSAFLQSHVANVPVSPSPNDLGQNDPSKDESDRELVQDKLPPKDGWRDFDGSDLEI